MTGFFAEHQTQKGYNKKQTSNRKRQETVDETSVSSVQKFIEISLIVVSYCLSRLG
jgi:hypothetical protein